ncbi:MAG: cell surface protein SprA, partial [Candidatus Cloacimonetes bacterium]|nr:cell surface protein SprA [Candidatus Cloacimonadota bacterium]
TEYRDMDFTHNKYFFIGSPDPDDPNTIFHILEDGKLDTIGTLMPKEGTEIRIFVDDGKLDLTDITGYSIDENHDDEYKFQEYLFSTDDFFIDYINSPHIIEFYKFIGNNYVIGLIYEDRAGNIYGEYSDTLKVKLIKGDYTDESDTDLAQGAAFWDYQLKNKYYLGSKNIQSQGFEVEIYRYLPNGEKEEGIIDTTTSTYTPYIEILNLDTNDDGRVNGNDETVDLEKGVITFQMLKPFRKEWFANYDSTLGNDIIYEKLYPDPTDDCFNPFYISVKMKTTAGEINLGQMNVIKNSEKVYIDGDLKKRNEDYTIEYETGIVTFKPDAAPDPNADVKINFEYEPFFALDKKNMFGVRADYEFNKNAALGATIMYEAGSVKDERPKIGNEPKRILVGDIDGRISMDLPFITDLVDMIPLIKTREKSTFSLSGEVAMNIPNPNATEKQEAYIDDMEGVVESYSLGIGRIDWTFSSFPLSIAPEDSIRGGMQWYNPYNKFQAKDIYQDLTEREGKEYVSVLELKITPTESQTQYWGGIMKASASVDFSKKKYLELTMKSDENPGDTLFIDLGFISEDYYPILNPNGVLDEEDGCINGIKDGEMDIGEDIGLDRCTDAYEDGWGGCLDPDGPTYKQYLESGETELINPDANPDDPNGDKKEYARQSTNYSKINGTEGNDKLDSEDLNRNNTLDVKNNYLKYAIDLGNLDIDSEIVISESENKEWKFIRIPLQDSTYYNKEGIGNVDFSQIKYARIWAK